MRAPLDTLAPVFERATVAGLRDPSVPMKQRADPLTSALRVEPAAVRPPLPLLAFQVSPPGSAAHPRLVATGSLRACDPDRLVITKLVLSGYPAQVASSFLALPYRS